MTDHMNSGLSDIFASNDVITEENFTIFRSGGKGSDYVDIDTILGSVTDADALVEEIVEKIESDVSIEKYDRVAFLDKSDGPVGLLPYAREISRKLGKKPLVLRLDKRMRHEVEKVKGIPADASLDRESILLVDDVVTTGNTQRDAIELVENRDGNVNGLLAVYVRDEKKLADIQEEKGLEYADSLLTYVESLERGLILSDDPADYRYEGFEDRLKDLYDLDDEEVAMLLEELNEDTDEVLREAIMELIEEEGLAESESEKEAMLNEFLERMDENFKDSLKVYLYRGQKSLGKNLKPVADD